MHAALELMSRYTGRGNHVIRGDVIRRWVEDLIAYTQSLEETIHVQDAEIALLKTKQKGKAA